MATKDDVVDALATEAEYRRRRWGVRQPDGSFVLPRKNIYQYAAMMRYYYGIAYKTYTETPGYDATVPVVLKLAGLVQSFLFDYDVTLPEVWKFTIGERDLTKALLLSERKLNKAVKFASTTRDVGPNLTKSDVSAVKMAMIDCLALLLDGMLGQPPIKRDLSKHIINALDDQPA